MSANDNPILLLHPHLHPSPYGRPAASSLATHLHSPSSSFLHLLNTRYGELWISDHPSGESTIPTSVPVIPETKLSTFLASNSGSVFLTAAFSHLPFIFKILSFDRPLPLQVHPKQDFSKLLHEHPLPEAGPQIKDSNHKPEVAVGLKDGFTAFVGFRPREEIEQLISEVPELKIAIGGGELNQVKDAFERTLKMSEKEVAELVDKLQTRAEGQGDRVLGALGVRDRLVEVFNILVSRSRKGDPGIFAALIFLNLVRLGKGQGVAVPAGCVHAYVEGEAVECMARSDNMIAHGFEKKKADASVDMLVQAADFGYGDIEQLRLQTKPFAKGIMGRTTMYQAPIEEFDLLNVELEKAEREELEPIQGPAVFMVTSGEAKVVAAGHVQDLKEGMAFLLRPGVSVKISSENGADLWGAFVEGSKAKDI